MPSAKQRGSKGGHGSASPSDKGAHPSGGADDVAKKPPSAPQQPQPPAPHPQQQHPQNQAHRGGHRGRSSAAAAASSASCSRRLGRLLNFLFYLALVAAAAFSGWCVHHVLEEVQQVRRGHQDFSRQREELGQSLQGVEQKVQSLQATFGTFESILRSSQHKQDLTEKAVKQGESEINRISEVLQKLQNEILKDLSDGIHVVKDARERDFTSLENTVEERLTELTKSINDNIAIFTDVQKRSQKEINDVKMKVASLEESKGDRSQDLKVLEKGLKEVQASLKSRERDIEALQSSLQTMESDVYTEVRELVSLKQEQQAFKQAADSERLALEALTEKLLQSEESSSRLPADIRRLEEELQQLKAQAHGAEEAVVFKDSKALDELQRQIEGLGARLQYVEDGVYSMQVASARHTESLESLLSKSQEYEQRLAVLQEHLETLGPASDLASTVKSLEEAQLMLTSNVKELQQSLGELPNTVESLQEQVHSLLSQDHAQAMPPQDFLDRLSSLDNLKSSVSQVESDLKMLRTAVDSLVAYSVKIETNENNLESAKGLLDDLRNDLDRLFVKVEKIHEKI
ncbi:cytoskeleton-associated protein 4 isoform X2 [Cricetulus griseus]|uniref:Cytoskeleton-associated protein 4 isoform X2 n=1 Tax=Cricetulus griseus TaxID=10029 RepID=A0A9J7F639_CRIGR|nr:cytoskeleton-associated protein 4 isoform X2 [Cricetulus griseus]ERE92118.1 cytoskeleton-associated protein 4 [Cricetulus griseus]